jgi:mono/diheme cytochrome c family protein
MLTAATLTLIVWPARPAFTHSPNHPFTQSPAADTGARVYAAKKCDRCHMIAGKGNSRFPLDRVGAKLTTEDLRRWLTDTAEMEAALPKQPAVRMSEWMRTNRKMTTADIDAIVAYLATLK